MRVKQLFGSLVIVGLCASAAGQTIVSVPAAFSRALETGDLLQVGRMVDADKALLNQMVAPSLDFPLAFAVRKKNIALVKLLLEKGADPLKEGYHPSNLPAFLAAKDGNIEILDLLMKAGAKPDHVNSQGLVLFTFAVGSGKTEIVQYLLNTGLDIKSVRSAALPISAAASHGDMRMLEFLEKAGADVHTRPNEGIAVHSAIGSPNIIRWLIDRKVYLNARSEDGLTPLLYALDKGERPSAMILLDAGAPLNVIDPLGRAPLHFALLPSAPADFFESLLNRGADPELGSNDMRGTALMEAVRRSNARAVDVLLARKADINAKDCAGRTPMHIAAISMPDALEKLATAGADLNTYDFEGRTPLQTATRERKQASIDLLQKLGAKDLPPGPDLNIHRAISRNSLEHLPKVYRFKAQVRWLSVERSVIQLRA